MFGLMGNCMSWMKKRGEPRKKLTLVMIGLDNAGKTVTTKGLQGEPIEGVAPTVGFSSVNFTFEKFDITMFDLGGGQRIRGIWKNYFAECYGVIFVIDSSDEERLEECKNTLSEVLENSKITGKPVLVLANKQDIDGCYNESELCEYLNLEEVVNINKCPCRLETCAAVIGTGKKIDPSIKMGMQWLLHTIDNNYEKYHERVDREVTEQKEEEKKERQARLERVRKLREEREREEELERQKNGEPAKPDSDDEDIMDGSDPFKKLNYNELVAKEARLKEESKTKKKKKVPEQQSESQENVNIGDNKEVRNNEANNGNNNALLSSRKSRQSHNISDNDEDADGLVTSRSNKSDKVHKDSPRPLDGFPLHSARRLAPLTPLTNLEPLDGGDGDGKKKRKKKKIKKNKTAPMDFEDNETGEVSFDKPTLPPLKSASPPAQRNFMSRTASKKPQLDSVDESFGQKWGLVNDLPEAIEDTDRRQSRPNSEYDEIMT